MDKQENIEEFLKEAFCIDGECKRYKDGELKLSGEESTIITSFKLYDSRRGEFIVVLKVLK